MHSEGWIARWQQSDERAEDHYQQFGAEAFTRITRYLKALPTHRSGHEI
jgi:hypothetical protein